MIRQVLDVMKKGRLFSGLLALILFISPVATTVAESDPFTVLSNVLSISDQVGTEGEEGDGDGLLKPGGTHSDTPQYTVTFDVDGSYTKKLVDENTLVRRLPDPVLGDGSLNFTGWYNNGELFDFLTPITSDIVLTAVFADGYLVEFTNSSGYVVAAFNVDRANDGVAPFDGAELGLPLDEAFVHWYAESADPAVPYDFSQPISGNMRFSPYITSARVVVFVSEGTQVEPLLIEDGIVPERPEDPERPGYVFAHWSTAKDGEEAYEGFGLPYDGGDASLTLYAVWETDKVGYTIEYWIEKPDVAGTPNPAANPDDYMFQISRKVEPEDGVEAGAEIELKESDVLAFISKDSANADRAYLTKHFVYIGATEKPEALGDGSTIVKVYYNRKVYKITFRFNSGTATSSNNAARYYIGDDTVGVDAVANPDYVVDVKLDQNVWSIWPRGIDLKNPGTPFSLWGAYYSFSQRPTTTFSSSMYDIWSGDYSSKYGNKNLIMTASYKGDITYFYRLYYLEMLDSTGVNLNETITVSSGDVAGCLLDPTHIVGKSIARYVSYNGAVYKLALQYTSGYQQGNASGVKGWPGAIIPGYVQANFNQTGDHQGGAYLLGSEKNAANQAIYGLPYYCDLASYDLTFNGMGGKVFAAGGDQGTSYEAKGALVIGGTLPDGIGTHGAEDDYVPGTIAATKANATFMGWYYDAGYTQPANAGDPAPTRNMTLYAKFVDSGVTVRFFTKQGDTNPLYTLTTRPGGYIQYPQGSYAVGNTYNGNVFDGWVILLKGIPVKFSTSMPVYNSVDLYATWLEADYTVVYYADAQESAELSRITVKSAAGKNSVAGSLHCAPEIEDISFIGWYRNPEGTGARFTASTYVTEPLVKVYPVFAAPITVSVQDVYADTAGASAGVLNWASLTQEALLAAGITAESSGHANVSIVSKTSDFSDKTAYLPVKNSLGDLTADNAKAITVTVTDSLGRKAVVPFNLYVVDTQAPKFADVAAVPSYRANTLGADAAAVIRAAAGFTLSDDYASAEHLEAELRNNVSDVLGVDAGTPGTYTVSYWTYDTVLNEGRQDIPVTIWDEAVEAVSILRTVSQVEAMLADADSAARFISEMSAIAMFDDGAADSPRAGEIAGADLSRVLAQASTAENGYPGGYPVVFTSSLGTTGTANVIVVPSDYVISTSAENGTISPFPSDIVAYDGTITVSYQADEWYHLAGITVDGEPLSAEALELNATSYTFENVTAEHAIHVVFEKDTHSIITVVENGTITPDGAASVLHGEDQLVKYAAADGYQLASIQVDGKTLAAAELTANAAAYLFENVGEDHVILVRYTRIPAPVEPDAETLEAGDESDPTNPTNPTGPNGGDGGRTETTGEAPVITNEQIGEARTRTRPSLFTIYDDDVPLAGMASRSMGDKEE